MLSTDEFKKIENFYKSTCQYLTKMVILYFSIKFTKIYLTMYNALCKVIQGTT